ncbi:MAG: hypothetical protein Ct9H90mP23_2460 [Methanobacteriota archaeon]|jgi:hypothetical protein|nr:MAG: hypothetical protein Ct9H90mP23_2460 [Euryarchaeota archaeon]
MVPDSVEATSVSTTSALIHTGLLSVGLSNLFWKGSELNADDNPETLLLVAMALFCIAIPFQGLYILLSRMIREYPNPVMVPSSVLHLASRCEVVSYACGITGFCLMLVRTSNLLAATLIGSAILVIIMARSALSVPAR